MSRDLLRRVARARIAQTSVSLLGSQVLLGVSGIIAARTLGPSGRGIVVGVGVWMGFLPWLFLLGMNAALGVRIAHKPRDIGIGLGSALVYLAIVGVPVAIGAAFVVPRIVSNLGGHAPAIARWAVPLTVLMAMLNEMLLSMALARGRYFVFNGCRILLPLIPLGVAIGYTITGGLTPTLMVGANVAATALCLIWLAASTPWIETSFDRLAFLSDLGFGLRSAFSGWAGAANERLDFLLMSAFVSATQLGYYGVANNVMLPVTTIPFAAAALLTPRVAAVLGDESLSRDEIIRNQASLIWSVVRRYLVVAIVGGIAFAACAPFLIPALFGRSFHPAIVLIWILVPGFAARAVTAIIVNGTTGMRYPRVGNTSELVALVVTVALLAALLPQFAARGAAIASTVAYVTSALVAVIGLRRLELGAIRRAGYIGQGEVNPSIVAGRGGAGA